jgi:hypothetical protein
MSIRKLPYRRCSEAVEKSPARPLALEDFPLFKNVANHSSVLDIANTAGSFAQWLHFHIGIESGKLLAMACPSDTVSSQWARIGR